MTGLGQQSGVPELKGGKEGECSARMEVRDLKEGEEASSIGPCYIVQFSSTHLSFRLAEFRAGADYLDVKYAFVSMPCEGIPWAEGLCDSQREWQDAIEKSIHTSEAKRGLNVQRPFMLVHLASDQVAVQLSKRVSCIKGIWQQWASGRTIDEVRASLQQQSQSSEELSPWKAYCNKSTSWRATVVSYQRSIGRDEQLERVELFKDILAFQGPIRMKGADLNWGYIEEWTPVSLIAEEQEARLNLDLWKKEAVGGGSKGGRPQRQRLLSVHVGRKVADGTARDLIATMDVKKRAYIGNTTMESQMSLVTAGMALAGPGKMVYDPFAGTCSLLLAAAALGAHVLASDIDGRAIRGKSKRGEEIGVIRSAKQYGVEHHFLDGLCADISQHPWRSTGLFDAIIADPPYGVRAGAKQLGKREVHRMRDEPFVLPNGEYSHQQSDYIPPTKPYALDDLLVDLMNISAKLLTTKGRLVFWMPTMIESDVVKEDGKQSAMQELQLELTSDFELVAHSLQDFGSWGRWLITLQKVDEPNMNREEKHQPILPAPPARHRHGQTETRIRATDDPNEFRNRFLQSVGHR